jgi:hypothetical protein
MDEPPLESRPRQSRGVAACTGRTAPSVTEQPRRPPSPPPRVYLAQRSERRAHLLGEQLGLLPGGEVPALVDLVEIGEVGVCLLARPRGGVGPDTGVRRKLAAISLFDLRWATFENGGFSRNSGLPVSPF